MDDKKLIPATVLLQNYSAYTISGLERERQARIDKELAQDINGVAQEITSSRIVKAFKIERDGAAVHLQWRTRLGGSLTHATYEYLRDDLLRERKSDLSKIMQVASKKHDWWDVMLILGSKPRMETVAVYFPEVGDDAVAQNVNTLLALKKAGFSDKWQ